MVRGKYAAKAKNRLADLDNEILQELVAERDQLRAELTRTRKELNQMKADLSSRAMKLGSELAHDEVESVKDVCQEAVRRHLETFEEFGVLYLSNKKIPSFIRTAFSQLLGMEQGFLKELASGEYRMNRPRRERRHLLRGGNSTLKMALAADIEKARSEFNIAPPPMANTENEETGDGSR